MNNTITSSLGRGLALIDYIVKNHNSYRYKDLKAIMSDIPEPSFGRLIGALVELGALAKENNRYSAGTLTLSWKNALTPSVFENSCEALAEEIAAESRESCAIAQLTESGIKIVGSKTHLNSIHIISKNSLLHFESDHAGALAILDEMNPEILKEAIKSSSSAINSLREYKNGIRQFKKGDYFLDRSLQRPGVSRMSVGFKKENRLYSLFLCSTTKALELGEVRFRKILSDWRTKLVLQD